MIFELVQDFAAALDAMPCDHPRWRIVSLLDEAIRRDVHLIDRHPPALFQCLWNSCWWYDCPEAAKHYDLLARAGWTPLPWEDDGRPMSRLLEACRVKKAEVGCVWLRSLRPPAVPLDSPQRLLLRGQVGGVNSACFSPDGRHILSASDDIRVWDARSGAELLRLRGHQKHVVMAAYSRDGSRIVSRSVDDTLRVWDARTGDELLRLEERGWVASFSPDGRSVVGDIWGGPVVRWDARSGSELGRLEGIGTLVEGALVFSPDGGRIMVSTGLDSCVRVHDASDGRELLRLSGSHAVYSPDGRWIAAAFPDRFGVCVWDAESGADRLRIMTKAMVCSLAISPDGGRFAVGTADEVVLVLDAATGAELNRFKGHHREAGSVAFSPDGRYLASASADETTRVWDTGRAVTASTLIRHEDEVRDLRFAPDGRCFLTHSRDHTVRVWDSESGVQLLVIPIDFLDTVGFAPEGDRIIGARVEIDRTVYIWDAVTGESLRTLRGKGGAKVAPREAADGPWVLRGKAGRNKWLNDYFSGAAEVESAVASNATGASAAWFPELVEHAAAHPSGRRWAGHIGGDICLLALEGEIDVTPGT